MSDYQNLDLRSPQNRSVKGTSMRGVLITLAVVVVLFLLLALLGAGTGGDEPAVPAGAVDQTAPAATQTEDAAPAATQPAVE